MKEDKNILWAIGAILFIIIIVLLVRMPGTGYYNNLGASAYVPYSSHNTYGTSDQAFREREQAIDTNTTTTTTPSQQVTTYTTTTQTTPSYTPTSYTTYDNQYTQPNYYTNQYNNQYQYTPQYPYQYQNQGGCYVSGYSNQVCSDQVYSQPYGDYNPRNSCYQQYSTCTRQYNGQCGWTQTQGLQSCLNRGY